MSEYITALEGYFKRNERQALQFNEYCCKVRQILADNPQGLTVQKVQTTARLSNATTKQVLRAVATENNSLFYLKQDSI